MIDIKEVSSKADMRKFVDFPLRLYKGNPNFTPSFYSDELTLFGDKNVYNEFSDSKFFLAIKDGRIAGRLAIIVNHAYNKKTSKTNARFSRFDVIDDIEVSKALFFEGEKYAKSMGMDVVHGPLGYMDIDKEGMLIKGYEYPEAYGGVYNFPYYNEHMEKVGYEKEIDWIERRITIPKVPDPKIMKVTQLVKKRYHLRDVVENDSKVPVIIKKYGAEIFKLIDEAYAPLHGTVPITPKVRDLIISQLNLILNPKFISLIVNEDDLLVGFGIVLPAMWTALNKSKGKLFPTGAIRLLMSVKKYEEVEFGLIAIKPGWQKLGVTAVIIERIMNNLIQTGVKFAETNAMLENNDMIKNLWDNFDSVQHKSRRCYIKKI